MWKDAARGAKKHLADYGIGYGIAVFLAIAAATSGFRTGGEGLDLFSPVSASAGALLSLLREGLAVLALWLCSLHPFGCALCAALLVSRAFSVGMAWSAWIAAHGWAGALAFGALLVPQGLLSLAAWCVGCCVTAYAALRARIPGKTAYACLLAAVFAAQALALALRCLASACLA